MDILLSFIDSDIGKIISWCFTVGGVFIGIWLTYNVHTINVTLSKTINLTSDSSNKNDVIQDGIGNKNSNVGTVNGNMNIDM